MCCKGFRPSRPPTSKRTASPHSDDSDAIPGTQPKRSDTNCLAILEPWHLLDTTEYGQIEYGGLPVNADRVAYGKQRSELSPRIEPQVTESAPQRTHRDAGQPGASPSRWLLPPGRRRSRDRADCLDWTSAAACRPTNSAKGYRRHRARIHRAAAPPRRIRLKGWLIGGLLAFVLVRATDYQ